MIDLSELEKIANGDKNFLREMTQLFISTTEQGIKDIERALASGDFEKVADHAHRISSPCRHMGAIPLLNLLKALEKNARQKMNEDMITASFTEMQKEARLTLGEARNLV